MRVATRKLRGSVNTDKSVPTDYNFWCWGIFFPLKPLHIAKKPELI